MRYALPSIARRAKLVTAVYNKSRTNVEGTGMKHYSLREVQYHLGIDDVTLWRWMRAAGVKPRLDPGDYRRRRLSEAQLIELAQRHHRLVVIQQENARLSDIEARIYVLEQEVLALSHTVKEPLAESSPQGEEEPAPTASETAARVDALLAQVRAMQHKQAR